MLFFIAYDKNNLLSLPFSFTCDVKVILSELQYTFDIIVLLYEHNKSGDVAYSWRLVQLQS